MRAPDANTEMTPADVTFMLFHESGKPILGRHSEELQCNLKTDEGLQRGILFMRHVNEQCPPDYMIAVFHDAKGDTLFTKLFDHGKKTKLNKSHPAFLQSYFSKLQA